MFPLWRAWISNPSLKWSERNSLNAFSWGNWIATDAMWADHWLGRRSFAIRGKLAEAVVRDAYARLASE